MIFKFGHVPPRDGGGFHFPQKLPNGGVRMLYGSVKEELDREITRFRVENSMEIGDPAKESNDYLCGLWPQYCEADPTTVVADESKEGKNLRQRATNWKYNRYAQAQEISERATQEEAEQRAAICIGCPKNLPNKDSCGTCVADNDRVFFMLRNGKKVNNQEKLGGCDITGQDNATAIHFVPEMLKYAQQYKDQLPDFCWLKHLNG